MKFPSVIAYVDSATHEAIRVAAFEENMSMSEWIGCVLRVKLGMRRDEKTRPRTAKKSTK